MNLRARLKLPREHGAWAMLYVPMLIGILVAGRFTLAVAFLVCSASLFFVARESLILWWRSVRRNAKYPGAGLTAAVYLGLAFLFAIPLVAVYQLWWLVPMSAAAGILVAINAEQSVRKMDRTIGGELLAILGLTSSGLAAHYVATGKVEANAFWLWGSCVLYFTSSIFYVRLRVYSSQVRKSVVAVQGVRLQCASYHLAMLLSVVVFWLVFGLSGLLVLAFAPILIRS
ncbi:MAG TPA: YwiC-like family protein, partial [Blastocatellia bacterium]|nr:YwiC-like family protein [Blastocatellia bacterium]